VKKLSFALAIIWGMSMLFTYDSAAAEAAKLAIVPQPQEVKAGTGSFKIKPATAIVVDKDSPDAINVGKQLAERLRTGTGMELKVSTAEGSAKPVNAIHITTTGADAALGAEGYRLTVSPDGVTIVGGGGPGMFYGMQTLLQLLPPQVFGSAAKADAPIAWTVPAVEIKDQPRFPWRGLLLDVARHFVNKQEIKNFLDLMAQHKLNTFHFHLTDDPGWRLEIKKYPKLAEVGGWRKGIDFGLDPKAGTAYNKDGQYGGFYTQDEMREIVAYAKARYITIVPEIEMPGHSAGALSAYPEFSCFGGPYDRDSGAMGIYCPGNDAAFSFLEDILTEVMPLFPGKYIHIGGDEVDKTNWTKCEKCQARIKQENLKDVNELQSYFIKRIEKFLNEKGRTLIGWDEILEGGLAPNATVMSWRSVEGGITAANAGHDVVMTPLQHCYLDYYQAKNGEPKAIGGYLPLEQVYRFEPIVSNIAPDKAKHVLGAAGNLWSEYFPNYAHVQYMGYPRACAIAEVSWTDPKLKNWEDFKSRMETQFQRLKAQGVNYRAPKPGVDPGY
jgi:hexosaminidase